MLNKVMIIGRLGSDPKLTYTQSGAPVCNFSVATDESYQDRDGNRVERTEWHRIVVFQRAAENCANFLSKGSLVYVEGSLTTRKWTDQQGQERYTTEIKAQRVQFLDRKSDSAPRGYGADENAGSPRRNLPPRQYERRPQPGPSENEDLGSPFPSGANMSDMDTVPF